MSPRWRALVMLCLPFVAGIATTIALWGEKATPLFFASATEVIALGAVAMALDGRLFRVSGPSPRRGAARATVLVAVGVGLAFAFGALARGEGGGEPHLAMTAGALAMGAAAIALEAIFGLGTEDEPAQASAH